MDSRNGEAKILVVDDIPENVRLMEAVLVLGVPGRLGEQRKREALGVVEAESTTSSCST